MGHQFLFYIPHAVFSLHESFDRMLSQHGRLLPGVLESPFGQVVVIQVYKIRLSWRISVADIDLLHCGTGLGGTC